MDKQHGGRRPGAGRKPKPEGELYVKQHISLPPDLFDWLKRTNDRTGIAMSRIIQLALEEYQKKAWTLNIHKKEVAEYLYKKHNRYLHEFGGGGVNNKIEEEILPLLAKHLLYLENSNIKNKTIKINVDPAQSLNIE